MPQLFSIVLQLKRLIDSNYKFHSELKKCFSNANWTPPYRKTPITNAEDFYEYLEIMLQTTPVEKNFSNLFHGLFYIISQNGNKFQKDPSFSEFKNYMIMYAQQYGSFMNMTHEKNPRKNFLHDFSLLINMLMTESHLACCVVE